jgi:ribosome-binding factor A
MSQRMQKVEQLVKELTAQFLNRESTNASLITVTSASVSPDLKKATIFITAFPDTGEKTALLFAKRKRSEMREFLKEYMQTKNVPFIDVEIDRGEKNRQKIDELIREK